MREKLISLLTHPDESRQEQALELLVSLGDAELSAAVVSDVVLGEDGWLRDGRGDAPTLGQLGAFLMVHPLPRLALRNRTLTRLPLRQLTHLKALELDYCTGLVSLDLGPLANLEELTLRSVTLQNVQAFASLSRLRRLVIGGSGRWLDDCDIGRVPITELDLSACRRALPFHHPLPTSLETLVVGAGVLAGTTELPPHDSLLRLRLDGEQRHGVASLSLGGFPRLEELVVSHLRELTSVDLAGASRLRRLVVRACPKLARLSGLDDHPGIVELELAECASLEDVGDLWRAQRRCETYAVSACPIRRAGNSPLSILVASPLPLKEPHGWSVPRAIDGSSFSRAIADLKLSIPFDSPATGPSTLRARRMSDLHPSAVLDRFATTRHHHEVRCALTALKGPLGGEKAFRNRIQRAIDEETEQLREELATPNTAGPVLMDILETTKMRPGSEGYDVALRGVATFIARFLEVPRPGRRVDKALIEDLIVDTDAELSTAVDAVLHDPQYQDLERVLRSLQHLVDVAPHADISLLPCGKGDLVRTLEPYAADCSMVVCDHRFTTDDEALLIALAQLVSPVLVNASRRLLTSPFAAEGITLCGPSRLLRLPYGNATNLVREFNYEESCRPFERNLLWGGAALTYASRRANSRHHDRAGGAFREQPEYAYETDGDVRTLPPLSRPFSYDEAHALALRGRAIAFVDEQGGLCFLDAPSVEAGSP